MSHRVLLASGVVAVVGALLWGAITYFTGYEVGYVAWLIGAMIGGAAVAVGGKGQTCGMTCAGLAIGAIFLGKVLAVQFSIGGQLTSALEAGLTRATYDEAVKDAAAFAELKSPEEYPAFMVSHEFTDAKTVQELAPGEVDAFTSGEVPRLRRLHEQKLDYPTWRKQTIDEATELIGTNLSISKMVVSDLGPIDLIFGVLGVMTAYRIPARREG